MNDTLLFNNILPYISGKRLLDINGRCALRTDDGCDVDNDEGLAYAVGERQRVIFVTLGEANTNSDDREKKECAEVKPWPSAYNLPAMPEAVLQQINGCKTSEDAVRLKCRVNFCSTLCAVIANDLLQFTGKEL